MNGPIPQSERAGPVRRRPDGYSYLEREDVPNYWAYADRFVLADHFFTPMYGPTLPEHLYAVAAQSNFIVDNKSTTDHEGSYCDDPTENATRFIPGEARPKRERGSWSSSATSRRTAAPTSTTSRLLGGSRLCFDIPVLPDQLEAAGHQLGLLRDARTRG